jgi:hypothetical protein
VISSGIVCERAGQARHRVLPRMLSSPENDR